MLTFKGEFCCVRYRSERNRVNPQYDAGAPGASCLGVQGTVESSPEETQAGQVPQCGELLARGNQPFHSNTHSVIVLLTRCACHMCTFEGSKDYC